MSDIWRDVTIAWRRLRRTPAFSLTTIATLAVGVGTCASVLRIVDPLLLRTLPVRSPASLVQLHSAGPLAALDQIEPAAFARLSAADAALAGTLAEMPGSARDVVIEGRTARATVQRVTTNYFAVLGLRPAAGRLFHEDDASDAAIAVVGAAFWNGTLGGAPAAVGQTVVLAGRPLTIVGVAPRGFPGLTVGAATDVYVPLDLERRPPQFVTAVARLAPGVTAEAARTRLDATFLAATAESSLPEVEREQLMARLLVTPIPRGLSPLRDRFGTAARILGAIVVLLLAVACANVGGLAIARAAGEQGDLAVELALGASPWRLARRRVIEVGLLAGVGFASGLVVSSWVSTALVSWMPGDAPVSLDSSLDLRAAAAAGGVFLAVLVLCGWLPVRASLGSTRPAALASGRAAGLSGSSRSRGRRFLVVAQLAISIALLTGSGLLARSLVNLGRANVGFDAGRVLAVSLRDTLPSRPAGQAADLLARLLAAARAVPGVANASLASFAPFSGREIGVNVVPAGPNEGRPPSHTFFQTVWPGYFETMGIPIVAGRACAPADAPGTPPVAILGRRLADRLLGADSVGRAVRFVEGNRPPMTVVGVVDDARYNAVREAPLNFMYLCPQTAATAIRGVLLVRSTGPDAGELAATIPPLLSAAAPGVTASDVSTMGALVAASWSNDRVVTGLAGTFTGVVLFLAAIGVYGLLSSSVTGQRREIGVRLALGASRSRIVRLVAGPVTVMLVAGLVPGVALAAALTPLMRDLLFEVDGIDPATIGIALAVMAVAGAAAAAPPLRRALRTDPAQTLRSE
ncbi:MAG: ABC transporter permease [Vicinamibacterales bacterium]